MQEQTKYIIQFTLGLGMDNVIGVKVNSVGQIIIADLEEKIEAAIDDGKEPFLVCATAGMQ